MTIPTWRAVAWELGLLDSASTEGLAEVAIDRLEHGDVTLTQYGTRVALRPDLHDDRVAAKAYWPDNDGCKCYRKKAYGQCSHEIAARMYRWRGREIQRILNEPPVEALTQEAEVVR